LGESEAPFFGASRKRRREKSGEDAPFFAVLIADWGLWGGECAGLWASTTSLRRLGGGQCLGRLSGGRGKRSGIAAAAAILAVYLTRSKPTARR